MISDVDKMFGPDDRTMGPKDAGGCFPLGGYTGDFSGYSGDVSS